MIPPKICFTKSVIRKWAYNSEKPSNQPDYTCTLNLGLEKTMLIDSADMSHLPLISHWSSGDVLRKENFKIKRDTRIFAKSYQGRWILFPDLKLKQALNYFTHILFSFIALESLFLSSVKWSDPGHFFKVSR